jgi:hypothetical protein
MGKSAADLDPSNSRSCYRGALLLRGVNLVLVITATVFPTSSGLVAMNPSPFKQQLNRIQPGSAQVEVTDKNATDDRLLRTEAIVNFAPDLAAYEERERKEMEWLVHKTTKFLRFDNGLSRSQAHRIRMLMKAWEQRSSASSQAPFVVEQILQRLIRQQEAGNTAIKIDTKLYNIVLDSWSNSNEPGAAEKAEEILGLMETLYSQGNVELRPDESSYNACIKAYVRRGHHMDAVAKAEAILNRMDTLSSGSKPIRPNRRGYNLLLYALANSPRVDAAERSSAILKRMKEDDVLPDTNSYNQVIKAWSRGRQAGFEKSMMSVFYELVQLPDETNTSPDTDTFNAVMGGWLKSDAPIALVEILQVLQMMESSFAAGNLSAKPDQIAVNSVITAYARSDCDNAAGGAMELRERMDLMYSIKPDTVSNNILLDILSKSGQLDAAKRGKDLLRSMERDFKEGPSTSRGLRPDSYTYRSVIDCFIKSGSPQAPFESEALLERMWELHRCYGGERATRYGSVQFR